MTEISEEAHATTSSSSTSYTVIYMRRCQKKLMKLVRARFSSASSGFDFSVSTQVANCSSSSENARAFKRPISWSP